jgi:K+-transporting ATPase ATPase B chain
MNMPVPATRAAQSAEAPKTAISALWRPALVQAFVKLDPRQLVRSW